MRRRDFLAVSLAAACSGKMLLAAPRQESRTVPAWAPARGEIRVISYPPGRHPLGRGAVLAEIDPKFQAWNPEAPRQGPYMATEYYWGSVLGYSGVCHNTDTRQLVIYGAGHASINVCAPFAFDLNDQRWKWLDVPLPFDGYKQILVNRHNAPPSEATVRLYYPPEQLDYDWGELQGDWLGWPVGFGRPGIIQPIPSHVQAGMVHIPSDFVGNRRGGMLNTTVPTGVLSGVLSIGSHFFDFDTARWARTANRIVPTTPRSSVCNRETGKVYAYAAAKGIYVFDPRLRLWSLRIPATLPPTGVPHGGNVIHEASGLFVIPCARNALGKRAYFNDGETFTFHACSTEAIEGEGPFSFVLLDVRVQGAWPLRPAKGGNTSIGWAYCPADRCLYAVNGVGGSNQYWRLSPPHGALSSADHANGTWTLTEHTFAVGALTSASPVSWVYNRLSWDNASQSFIWFSDSINGPVQAFRPAKV